MPEPTHHPLQESTPAISGAPRTTAATAGWVPRINLTRPGTTPPSGKGATRLWYLSSQHMTLGVVTAHPSDRVLEAPPIARRFVGEPLENLVRWMGKQPGFRCQLIPTAPSPVPEHESACGVPMAPPTTPASSSNPSLQVNPHHQAAEAPRLTREDFPTGLSASSGRPRSVVGSCPELGVLPRPLPLRSPVSRPDTGVER